MFRLTIDILVTFGIFDSFIPAKYEFGFLHIMIFLNLHILKISATGYKAENVSYKMLFIRWKCLFYEMVSWQKSVEPSI